MRKDLSDMSYAASGVSIAAQNKVNAEVARRLRALGMRSEGLFGGAVDVSSYKGQPCFIDISCASVDQIGVDPKLMGQNLVRRAKQVSIGTPLCSLDYIALEEMGGIVADFVEGVGIASDENGFAVIGGESAEMNDTYQPGVFDAFVHVLSANDSEGVDITDLIRDMEQPLLVASTDGTGTKTKIVRDPRDIIYHGFNDIAAQGVKPIAFALYIAGNNGQLESDVINNMGARISEELGVVKLKSHVVQKPSIYLLREADIAGTVIGVIDAKNLITGKGVKQSYLVIGFGVDGLMTNGYTLARAICKRLVEQGVVSSMDAAVAQLDGKSLKYELSKPHRPMTDILFGADGVEGILSKYAGHIKGMAHITGGGQEDNIVRMIPDGCGVNIQKGVLPIPPFMKLAGQYGVGENELYEAFNMGVGFTVTASPGFAQDIVDYVNDNFRYRIEDVDRQAAVIGVVREGEPRFKFV